MAGRTIKIFLIDGLSSGMRTAEISNCTIKSLVIPRASLSIASKRPEIQKTGVYILIGADPDIPGQKIVYIGEGDAIITRLNSHDKDPEKDFWDEVITFVSKDENLTKSHSRYLEARMISLAKDARRSKIANSTNPQETGKLPEADQAEMEEFIQQAKLLLGTLGYDIFEQSYMQTPQGNHLRKSQNELSEFIFSLEGDNYNGKCIIDIDAGQFIVQKGSIAKKKEVQSLQKASRATREQLLANGVIVENDSNTYIFTQDYAFSSISSAAQTITGSSVNGRNVFKNSDGKTFADWQSLNTEETNTLETQDN